MIQKPAVSITIVNQGEHGMCSIRGTRKNVERKEHIHWNQDETITSWWCRWKRFVKTFLEKRLNSINTLQNNLILFIYADMNRLFKQNYAWNTANVCRQIIPSRPTVHDPTHLIANTRIFVQAVLPRKFLLDLVWYELISDTLEK